MTASMTETIVVAILGSNALFGFITFLISRRDSKNAKIDKIAEQSELNRETLATVSYTLLADKLEHRIERGYATKAHRHEIKLLHDTYEKNGWNGDMDGLFDKFYALPFEPPKSDFRSRLP